MSAGKIKILEVNKAYYPHTGGIENLVRQYSEDFSKKFNADVDVLVCREDFGRTYSERVNGIHVTRAGSFGTYLSCPVSVRFISLFRQMSRSADAVHIHTPFPLADLALLLSGYRGKVVVSWHSDIVKQKMLMPFYKLLMLSMLRRADYIVTATEGHIENSDVLRQFRDKCRVIPYGIDCKDYSKIETGFLSEKCVYKNSVKIFFTGRLVYYKGVDVLLKAFARLKNCELFIAGTGVLENSLRQLAVELDISEKVHFMGFLPDKDLKKAYSDCDIFVLPSVAKSEAFGLVQLEAMACGKPVVNTRLKSGVPLVSLHGKTGFTVPPSDHAALAKALSILAENPALREKLGRNGVKRVNKYFNRYKNNEKLFNLISS